MEKAVINKKGARVAIITMICLFAMISFVTNMAAPFGTIWENHYEWAGMAGNFMNFAAYLFMGIPAGMMINKIGYKRTILVALAFGFIGITVQYVSSTMDGNATTTYLIYLSGAFICGFCVCILNAVVNPMLNLLGGGGNCGNQLIQIGGSLNSLTATLTPMLVGMMIGQVTKQTNMSEVSPLLLVAMGIFALTFAIVWFLNMSEPPIEHTNVMEGVKGALSYRHFVLGSIAIFFYVGIEVGIPAQLMFYLSEPVAEGGVLGDMAIGGAIAGIYWFMMLIGRFVSAFISGRVSSRIQLIFTSLLAIVLLIVAIVMPKNLTIELEGGEVPAKVLFIILCGLCTSVMWGAIFNLSTKGLGRFTASASGLFMTMVVGGGIMPYIQYQTARSIGDILSYWIVIGMLAYLLYYALIGCKPVGDNKLHPVS